MTRPLFKPQTQTQQKPPPPHHPTPHHPRFTTKSGTLATGMPLEPLFPHPALFSFFPSPTYRDVPEDCQFSARLTSLETTAPPPVPLLFFYRFPGPPFFVFWCFLPLSIIPFFFLFFYPALFVVSQQPFFSDPLLFYHPPRPPPPPPPPPPPWQPPPHPPFFSFYLDLVADASTRTSQRLFIRNIRVVASPFRSE